MGCVRCSSDHQKTFNTEMNIHFPGREGLDKPAVWLFQAIMVCLDCGFAEFSVPNAELRRLGEDAAAGHLERTE